MPALSIFRAMPTPCRPSRNWRGSPGRRISPAGASGDGHCWRRRPPASPEPRNAGAPVWLNESVRFGLGAVRSLPGLIWGVIFVAAVGFGPLPGVLALGVHSMGMLGILFFEALEHVEPAPGAALRAQGASRLGVFRFALLPQALPRLTDGLIYRLEHNLRAATTLGVVGAGGFGLEIVTAFHLFEYREAAALILVLLALITAVNFFGAGFRRMMLRGM